MEKNSLRKKARSLPLAPGVYIMRDKNNKIIYIGKAKALRNRVSQYFNSTQKHGEKVARMVSLAENFDTIVCDSEFEALLLENSLIKQYQPKYNILLKDDKGFHYIRVTAPPWRRISATHSISGDGAIYLGPYNSSFIVSQTVDEAQKVFKLPACTRAFTEERTKIRPCLRFFIGQCSAPCAGKISLADYEECVTEAMDYIRGGSVASLEELESRMEEAAKNLEFEKAARLRDRINAIKRFSEKQKVVDSKIPNQDVIAFVKGTKQACFYIFRFRNRKLSDSEYFLTEAAEDTERARYEFIIQYYSLREMIPPVITLDGECTDSELVTRWLSESAGRRVTVSVPRRGDSLRLVEMCKTNAAEQLAQHTGRTGREAAALDELARLLGLPKPPRIIEAYDISHTAGTENVAGMVVYKNGRAHKPSYRKFKIRGFDGQDDYGSMREVLTRRFAEYEAHEGEDEGFGVLPDLILLDGGKGQVSAAREALLEAGYIGIPVFGMVKDDKHRTRAVTGDGGEIAIKSTRAVFTLITGIQDEVHRFAVGYHRQRRKKSALASALLDIPGVGEKRAKAILLHFGRLDKIRAAEIEDILKIKGMSRSIAENIYAYFRKN